MHNFPGEALSGIKERFLKNVHLMKHFPLRQHITIRFHLTRLVNLNNENTFLKKKNLS